MTSADVVRIEFEGKRAVGVDAVHRGRHVSVKANREVIISAGAINSPQLLMLSGVGAPDELKAHGIALVHALPGVGKNLQSFTAITTYESPASNGQPLYYSTLSAVEVQRPNKLRVVTPGDGPASEFYFDGKTMMAYSPAADFVAVADAPATIDEAVSAAYDKAAIYFPFADLIVADPYKNLSEGLTSAFFVGQSHVVGDTVTDMIAIANDHVQAEVWIGVNDGLPRMMHVLYPTDPAKSRYEIQFSNWHLNEPTKDADFTSAQAMKAPRIQFARPDAPAPAKP